MLINLSVSSKEVSGCHGASPVGPCGEIVDVTAMDTVSVPASLPLPPPPPPPPPPLPSVVGLTPPDSAPRSKLRSLYWERIPRERVEGRASVWGGPSSSSSSSSSAAAGAIAEDDFAIDLRSLDELFSQRDTVPARKAASFRHGQRCHRASQDGTEKVFLLDAKRSMNVGIFLRHFKSTAKEIVEDIRHGAGERYGAEKLSELYKLLPDSEEEKRVRSFQGDRSRLGEPDLFMLLLVELPSFRLRLDAMILKEDFDHSVTSLCMAARCLREAARELRNCSELHSILRLVLKAGNYMNAGSYAGNAAGFRIASLLRLADTKANKPGMNLLHFVAMEVVKKDLGLLSFPSQLEHVPAASRLCEESLQEDLSRLHCRLTELKTGVHTEPEVQHQTFDFLATAEERLGEAETEVKAMRIESQALVDFFCEDESTFRLEEACKVFHSFCQRFHKAVQENAERELKEQRRVERESVARRRSLGVCAGPGPSPGLAEDSLERALERTLSGVPTRRSLHRSNSQRLQGCPDADEAFERRAVEASLAAQGVGTEAGHVRNEGINTPRKSTLILSTASADIEHGPNSVTPYSKNGPITDTTNSSCVLSSDATDGQHGLSTDGPCSLRHDITPGLCRLRIANAESQHSTVDRTCSTCHLNSGDGSPSHRQEVTRNGDVHHRDLPGLLMDTVCNARVESSATEHQTEHAPSSRLPVPSSPVCERWRRNERSAGSLPTDPCAPTGPRVDAQEVASDPSQGSARLLRLVAKKVLAQQMGPQSVLVMEKDGLGIVAPTEQAQGAGPPASGRERTYSRVGETVECLTLVRGLHSYETLAAPAQRATPSRCSKWRREREREAEDKDRTGPHLGKDSLYSEKESVQGPRKGLLSRVGSAINSTIPRVRDKGDIPPAEDVPSTRVSRLPVTRSTSMRTSTAARPLGIQPLVKRASSVINKSHVTVNLAGKAGRPHPESTRQEKERTPSAQTSSAPATFVRGSPMRMAKRMMSSTESHMPAPGRTAPSPSSTTAKTIRTSVIAAAAVKAAKALESSSTRAQGSRLPGLKVTRPATQPMWR